MASNFHPRIRTIKPEMGRHEGLFDLEKELGLPIRFAWAMLPTQADREGRFQWRPRALKSQILPYDDLDFSRVLDALLTRGYLVKYRVGNEWFGWIPTFKKHQSINNKESASELPPPDPNENIIQHINQKLVIEESDQNLRVLDACSTREERVPQGKERKGKEEKIYTKSYPQILELTNDLLQWGRQQPEKFTEDELKKAIENFNLMASTRDKPFADLQKAFMRFMLADYGNIVRQRKNNGEDDEAAKAWEVASKACGNAQKAALLPYNLIQEAIKKIGGWSVLAHATPFENSTIWRPKFIAAYREVCQ